MKKPFFAAANSVIRMYTMRQERSSAKAPAHSRAEIEWVCSILGRIALAAAYAGCPDEHLEIIKLAQHWPTGHIPSFFSEETPS
ncbi:hypothetical protein C9426_10025 [Serratia sp. S1B]|nr:hypothetical protein C9426_10025 [Serratia sp. S1B]